MKEENHELSKMTREKTSKPKKKQKKKNNKIDENQILIRE